MALLAYRFLCTKSEMKLFFCYCNNKNMHIYLQASPCELSKVFRCQSNSYKTHGVSEQNKHTVVIHIKQKFVNLKNCERDELKIVNSTCTGIYCVYLITKYYLYFSYWYKTRKLLNKIAILPVHAYCDTDSAHKRLYLIIPIAVIKSFNVKKFNGTVWTFILTLHQFM